MSSVSIRTHDSADSSTNVPPYQCTLQRRSGSTSVSTDEIRSLTEKRQTLRVSHTLHLQASLTLSSHHYHQMASEDTVATSSDEAQVRQQGYDSYLLPTDNIEERRYVKFPIIPCYEETNLSAWWNWIVLLALCHVDFWNSNGLCPRFTKGEWSLRPCI